ncbi:MAG TPA: nitronate monooxygenase family protein [Dehalococcoidia bacterium]|nr:nitronate monooxygenase family protein [Dehalococcoidia bacterium]
MARPVLKTPLCEYLGIEYPIILAGMGAGNEGGAAGPELVAAVSEAGGLGVLGGTGRDEESFLAALAQIRKLTKRPFGVDVLLASPPSTPQPSEEVRGAREGPEAARDPRSLIDQRYWDWADETIEKLGLKPPPEEPENRRNLYSGLRVSEAHIRNVIREKPAVLAAGLGSPGPYVKDLHAAGIKVFGLVGNVKQAVRVKNDGVDAIVAQGHEAGGHTGRIGTFALVPQVIDAVKPTPVILAGGVGSGRHVAAALALGAQAVWVGTAFLATHEANITEEHRRHLLASTEEDTRVTRLYSGKTARALVNPIIESWEKSGLPALPTGLQGVISGRVNAAVRASGKEEWNMHLGGQIAGMIKQVRPAHVVLEEMVREAVEVLGELTSGGPRVTFAP